MQAVRITRKKVRQITVRVCPPDGQVRVTAPLHVSDVEIHAALLKRRQWILNWQQRLLSQVRASECAMISGEVHFVQGRAYPLQQLMTKHHAHVRLGHNFLSMHVHAGTDSRQRLQLLQGWYRRQLQSMLPDLLTKWQPVVGAEASECRIRFMQTRWGSCNIRARRIWLNLELIKYPPACLEYVLVHELTHLHERLHNRRFWSLMDQFMPDWRIHRKALRQAPSIDA